MAKYSSIHHRATLFGDMFGGTEIWSTGFALAQSNGGDEGEAPTVAEAQAIAEAFRAFFVDSQVGISDKYRFLGAKVAHVDRDGKSDAALTQYYNVPVPGVGLNTGVAMPPQVSVVATLATLKARGAGSKGRMYLPGISGGIEATGKLNTTFVTAIANKMKTFLDAVNQSAAVPGFIMLMSAERTGVPFRAAEQNRIASVRIGNVYDTQRRRRNQLVEQYTSATLA